MPAPVIAAPLTTVAAVQLYVVGDKLDPIAVDPIVVPEQIEGFAGGVMTIFGLTVTTTVAVLVQTGVVLVLAVIV